MKTVMCHLATKYAQYPDKMIPITCSDVDAEWIAQLPILLGENGHPTAPSRDVSTHKDLRTFRSLARRVVHHHGAPAEDDDAILRVDTAKPLDVSHENICVPLSLVKKYTFLDDVRSIPLSDYLTSFPKGEEFTWEETEPVMLGCICPETGTRVWLVGDEDDRGWLEHRFVKVTPAGRLLYQNDEMKYVPVVYEQARRSLKLEDGCRPVFHWLRETEPTDVRKCVIVARVHNRLFRGMQAV